MAKLTPKQERFCQLVSGGSTYADAYREAYSSRGKASTIQTEASKLARNPAVTHRVEALTEQKGRA